MRIMYVDASNNTPSYTRISSYEESTPGVNDPIDC